MFTAAAPKIFSWYVRMGYKTPTGRIKIHGSGCVLDADHVLGALHCWAVVKQEGGVPLLARKDGLFRGEVVFESPSTDVVIYRCVEVVDASTAEKIEEYPVISSAKLGFGQTVGYTAKLVLPGEERKTTTSAHFACGTVSMLTLPRGRQGHVYGLSGCICQEGCSGTGVFRPDSSLVGIIVEKIGFRIEESPHAPLIMFPALSPLYHIADEIKGSMPPASAVATTG